MPIKKKITAISSAGAMKNTSRKPKTLTLRFRATDRENFLCIGSGKKSIETRAATSKYADIQKGDVLIFTCGKEKIVKKIKKTEHFPSVSAMFAAVGYKKIMPYAATAQEAEKVYDGYSGYKEKIRQSGILAMWI